MVRETAMGKSFKQPGVRQLFLIGGGALVGAAVLFALWYLVLRVPYVSAFSDLKSSDAAAIVSELDRLKTPYRLTNDGATILVPSDKVDATRMNIMGGDLPLKGAVGFELFNKTDMGLSEFAQKINYQRALQGELARTIMALEEIDTARVHLSLPESGIFQRDRQIAKASVAISKKAGMLVDADVVSGIQQLVASAVPDLQAANVAILDARGRLLSEIEPTPILQSPRDERRSALEQMYAAKIRGSIGAAGVVMPMTVDVTSFENFAVNDNDFAQEGAAPRARTTPLRVSIGMPAEPAPLVRERLLVAVRQAVGFDASLGDVIAINIVALPGKPVRAPSQIPAASSTAVPPLMAARSWSIGMFLPVVAGLALILLGGIGWRLWSRRDAWVPGETEAFAARLKTLLEEDARNASSPV
jgi:flagellar M-ring protein FliF